MVESNELDLTVTEVRTETPAIRSITLARADGAPLPSWEAGAHINIVLRSGERRSYSLVNPSGAPAATEHPLHYRLGVRLENPSQGGSAFMHGLKVGDTIKATPPTNNFPLRRGGDVVLLAGGIGITPILSMAAALTARRQPFRLIYAARSRDQLAFLDEVQNLAGDKLTLHTDDDAGLFNVDALMRSLTGDEQLYVCGPGPMIDAAIAAAKTLGWRDGRLWFEIFSASAAKPGDAAFEVVLASTGASYLVPADKTILAALLEAGVDAMYDCQRGECGICQVGVIEGTPDHRDYILSDSEKSAGKLIQICVSRSKSPRLVLDL
ncbi:MAG: oxidoreductase [Rhodopseudomonas sp.]|uniref:PDR/VanB family oxidoreductase n=1 Tax=Rhodopseudomonas sp. TaxID=1078 RepID=UPI0017B06DC2|nr:PDR/VanB family oxidoreductase [Rhodopseudomonas sp.]NVN85499.1 oxidoreductase [Rhodopseudomonas sp.]